MICFDTGPVIWGVQGKASSGQAHMVERTRKYIRYLSEQKQRIMIPAPAVAEYLLGFAPKDSKVQQEQLERYFFIPAFDMRAAAVAAEIEGNTEVIKLIRKSGDFDKVKLRVDAQIIAIAIVNEAEKIISNDPHLGKLAQETISVEEVPDIPEQLNLDLK